MLWENKLSSSVEMLKREITRVESEMETCQHRLSVLIIFLSKSNKCDDADVKLCFASFSSFLKVVQGTVFYVLEITQL